MDPRPRDARAGDRDGEPHAREGDHAGPLGDIHPGRRADKGADRAAQKGGRASFACPRARYDRRDVENGNIGSIKGASQLCVATASFLREDPMLQGNLLPREGGVPWRHVYRGPGALLSTHDNKLYRMRR